MKQKYFLVLAILGIITVSGCLQKDYVQSNKSGMYKTIDSFQGNFSIYGTPLLNQNVDLIFSVNPIEDMPNSKIKLFLPEAVSIVNGSDEWTGNMKKGENTQLSTTLKVTTPGEWEIRAYVESVLPSGYKEYRSYYRCFKTYETSAQVTTACSSKPGLQQIPEQEQ